MAAPLAEIERITVTPVEHVTVGDRVRVYGHDWIIQERLPVFFVGGHALIGFDPRTHQRAVLMFQDETNTAEVIT